MNKLNITLFLYLLLLIPCNSSSQAFRKINGFSKAVNERLEIFLNSTITKTDRKVAVFDCDGTLLGQAPFYLSEEAIYSYAKANFYKKEDELSKVKMNYVYELLHPKEEYDYLQNSLNFLAGLSPKEIEQIGLHTYHEKFHGKFYPEMKQLLENLKEYGFEIWIITASTEVLYQGFINQELGIPKERIIGMKSVITADNIVSNQLMIPYPQDNGKAEAINTYIKTQPLLVAGNSRGDMEMMNLASKIKIIVNPDNTYIENGIHSGAMKGYTVKEYWNQDPDCLEVYCNDVNDHKISYASEEFGVTPNQEHKKNK
ncbi:HAD family phosphatase [Apibacter sp. HY039]|uniref:HAD family hydrolase n=1 Tax=Apibacter sp. HY039 TaxID=2501476 RepID=UPI000FEBE2D2|nr:haloacid dehalogenase-like hydrolase [Apibacter sp. HY039]